jgi:DNA helicase-2/ATP-dependent DNA helicase PcrA
VSLDLLERLNPEQREAVTHSGSPLLILAGAGSGKTRVITTKIAWLVRERDAAPESVLAVTFTNKAAREMQERAVAMDERCSRAMMRTFHSFGAWFLRRNGHAIGLDSNFTIYDDDDATTLVHAIMPERTRRECAAVASEIARLKDLGFEPDSPDLPGRGSGERDVSRAWEAYERKLRATGNVDFGDLIRLPLKVLRESPEIRDRFHSRFTTVLVDEYQDSNLAQFELLKALAGPEAYVCVVGDDDQSIYRFRGAEIRNILTFPEAFPGTRVIKLTRNYRSYQSILDVAADVVSNNRGRLGKELLAERRGGAKPELAFLRDHDEEAAYCADVARARVASGGTWSDVAILYRTNAQSLSFERAFTAARIPYRVVGALRFYEREEIKDSLAYLALAANPRDEIAFRRVINKPTRGMGDTSAGRVVEAAATEGGDVVAAARKAPSWLKGKAKDGCAAFVAVLDALTGSLVAPESDKAGGPRDSLAVAVERMIRASGLAEHYKEEDEIAGTQKAANLDELVNAASLYPRSPEGLLDFLEAIELDRSRMAGEEATDAVTLITIHNTKGLEFPCVIVTGLEAGLFPRQGYDEDELEEERRLFYVAITRAMDELRLTACRFRMIRGQTAETAPSPFLSEIGATRLRRLASRGSGIRPGDPRASASRDAQARADTGRWRAGMGAYHDDYGPGYVIKVEPSESGPVVTVRFETGKTAKFMTKYTSKLTPSG